MTIDGRWTGHYLQNFQQRERLSHEEGDEDWRPIEAEFTTVGTELSGTMRDLEPVRDIPIEQVLAIQLRPLKGIDRWKFLRKMPNYSLNKYQARLVPDSTIVGEIHGCDIFFSKTYNGPCEFVYYQDNYEQISRIHNHTVTYIGKLSPDGKTINGTYRLLNWRGTQLPEEFQTFELHRVE